MRKAFTLIELLVVIAIVALLAAILFPVFAKARERAKCAYCLSNLKQIGVAVQQYLLDYDEVYPYAIMDDYVRQYPNARPAFSQTMESYVTDQRIWQCPSDVGEILDPRDTYSQGRTRPFWSDQMYFESYGYPGIGWPDNQGCIAGKRTVAVKHPAIAVLAYEARPWHDRFRVGTDFYDSPALQNILHCDGHVDRMYHLQFLRSARDGVRP